MDLLIDLKNLNSARNAVSPKSNAFQILIQKLTQNDLSRSGFPISVFFFAKAHTFATTFSTPKRTLFEPILHPLIACSLRSHEKHSKIFRALRAPCFYPNFVTKHPSAAFNPTIRESKNFSSCFFLLPAVVAARSAPKKSFLPWDFSSETVSERR